jgi:hypothetical protein
MLRNLLIYAVDLPLIVYLTGLRLAHGLPIQNPFGKVR